MAVSQRVSAGIFVIRGKYGATARIQPVDIGVDSALVGPSWRSRVIVTPPAVTKLSAPFSRTFIVIAVSISVLGIFSFGATDPGFGLEKTNGRPDIPLRPPSIFHAQAFEQAAVSEPTTKWS
jgi:hypothetical protein